MIKRVEEADSRSQYGESWKLINEISGRKTYKKEYSEVKARKKELKHGTSISATYWVKNLAKKK